MESIHDADTREALDVLSGLKGELVWFVRTSSDNVLRMDFGEPHLKIREPNCHSTERSQAAIDALERRIVTPRGRFHLFVTSGEWAIFTNFYSCSRSDNNVNTINKTLRQLDGQRLINIEPISDNGWKLQFDLGGILHINSPNFLGEGLDHDEVQWTLFYEDGKYVSYLNNGMLRKQPLADGRA